MAALPDEVAAATPPPPCACLGLKTPGFPLVSGIDDMDAQLLGDLGHVSSLKQTHLSPQINFQGLTAAGSSVLIE
jgi:hypothetical protein